MFTPGWTAQNPAEMSLSGSTTPDVAPSAARPGSEEVTISAEQQERHGDVYKLRGNVVITVRAFIIRADSITYNAATGDVLAEGNLSLEGRLRGEHVQATRGSFNVQTEAGEFYNVTASAGFRARGRNVLLTTSNPFVFTGKKVERIPPNRYLVYQGSITTCEMPKPMWTFHAEEIQVTVGEDAKIYHSTFRLHDVPILYFPYVAHPINKLGRKSGFLIPSIGRSSQKGYIFGDSFYWAINPSMDLTVGAQYYSLRGWAQNAEFRARPNEKSSISMRFFGVADRGIEIRGQLSKQGGQEVRLSADTQFGNGLRAVADIDYLSSFFFRQAFAESFTQAINSEVKSVAFLTRNLDSLSFNLMASRYQNFQNARFPDPGSGEIPNVDEEISGTNNILILHAPSIGISSIERAVGGSRLFYSFDGAIEGVSKRAPKLTTAPLLGRYDVSPSASYALFWRGWTLRPEITLRNTHYTQRLETGGTQVSDNELNRRALQTGIEFRPPALQRVFGKSVLGHRLKHTIEPRITYRYVNGVDNFRNVIRFDVRDILTNTNEIEYAFSTRLYARRDAGKSNCPELLVVPRHGSRDESEALRPKSSCGDSASGTRELLSWDLGQKYYFDPTFSGNIQPDARNVFATSADFTGIAFITAPRTISPIVSRLRLMATSNTDIQWNLDYDTKRGRINASTALANIRFGEYFLGASHAFLPPTLFVAGERASSLRYNQIQYLVGYGHPNKRGVSAAGSVGFDVTTEFLQYSAAQISYNWDCCGISAEYRRFALPAVRNENQFRFAFILANVGSFGTLRRQERLF